MTEHGIPDEVASGLTGERFVFQKDLADGKWCGVLVEKHEEGHGIVLDVTICDDKAQLNAWTFAKLGQSEVVYERPLP